MNLAAFAFTSIVSLAAGPAISPNVAPIALAEPEPILISVRVLQIDEAQVDPNVVIKGVGALSFNGLPNGYSGDVPANSDVRPGSIAGPELTINTQHADGSSTKAVSTGMALAFVSNRGEIAFGEHEFLLKDPKEQPPFKSLAAPRIAVNPGQAAEITMGSALTMLEPAGEGLYRAVELKEFEGLKFSAAATRADNGDVTLRNLHLSLSQVQSRLPVPNLNLEAGRPLMRTSSLDVTMTIPDGTTAMFPFTDDAPTPRVTLLVLIRAEAAPIEDASTQDANTQAAPR